MAVLRAASRAGKMVSTSSFCVWHRLQEYIRVFIWTTSTAREGMNTTPNGNETEKPYCNRIASNRREQIEIYHRSSCTNAPMKVHLAHHVQLQHIFIIHSHGTETRMTKEHSLPHISAPSSRRHVYLILNPSTTSPHLAEQVKPDQDHKAIGADKHLFRSSVPHTTLAKSDLPDPKHR